MQSLFLLYPQFHGSQRTKQLEIFEFSRADSNTFPLLYITVGKVKELSLKDQYFYNFCTILCRGDRGIMGHGELRTSVIFLKTVSNYCPKTFFFEFSYSSPIFGTPVELRTRILTEL